jgi:hypothetical protein
MDEGTLTIEGGTFSRASILGPGLEGQAAFRAAIVEVCTLQVNFSLGSKKNR